MESDSCRFNGCGRVVLVAKHQLCQTHHKQFIAGEELKPIRTSNYERLGTCSFDGCRYITLRLCSGHIAQHFAGNELVPLRKRIPSETRDSDGRKWCYGCESWLTVECFSRASGKKDGLQPRCKGCAKAIYNHLQADVRSANRKGKYGLSAAAFQDLLDKQGGCCAICRTDNPGSKFWAVDHDHACCQGQRSCGNCVRGILCGPCNLGLGAFRDDTEKLRRAVEYLLR
jgi:hypothetical protein